MAKTSNKGERTQLTGALPAEREQAGSVDDTRFTRELIALSDVGQALISALDLEETLAIVTDRVTRLLGVEAASVILRDEVKGDLWFAAASGQGADFVRSARLPLGQGIAGWVVEHGEPVVVPDVLKDERFFGDFDGATGLATRSILCAPLRTKGQIIGAIEAMNKSDGLFDDYDLRLLTLMAAPAAAAIENARLFEQSRSRAEELATLNKLAQALTARLDVEGVLDEAYRGVSHLMDTTNFYVALYNLDRDEITFALDILEGEVRKPYSTRRAGRGLTEYVIRQQKPLLIEENVSEQLQELGVEQIGREALSWLGVPLIVGGKTVGMMAVQSYTTPCLYDEHDRDLLASVASQAAIAIQNARSYEQARAHAGELAVLNELSQALTARLSVDQVLEEAYRQAARLVDTTNFYIGIYDPDQDEITLPFIVSESEIDRHLTSISASQGFTGYIVRNRASVLVEEDVTGWLEKKGIKVVGEPSLSWLGVPLIVGDQVLGVMAVQSYTTPRLYGEHDLELLTAIAGSTAIAVQNAMLYEQAQREIAERKRVEEALRESERQYRTLVNTSIDAIISIDPRMKVTLWNTGAERVLGYTEEEMLGQTLMSIVPERYREAKNRGFAEFIKSGSGPVIGQVLELEALKKDGTEIPVEISISSREVGGAHVATAIARDITERRRAAEELQRAHQELERYTTILERQTGRLKVAAGVARQLSAILDVHQLLDQAVHLISNEFGFYHVGLFMVGEPGEYAILRAVSSEGGRSMLERGYRVPVGGGSAVGHVAASGEHRILLDVGEEAVSFDNPDLPDTRSEMCLPLRRGDRIVGVLDIHSAQEAAFSEQDALGFQPLADQLTVSIENARLVEHAERQLRETERLYGEYSAAAWAELLSPDHPLGYVYDRVDVLPAADLPLPTLALDGGGEEPVGSTLAVPLQVRGQTIGVLGVQESNAAREWSPEEMAIVEAVGDQVAMALDSARLFGETRVHADELAVLNELAQNLAARLTINDVLEETYQGVARLLDTTSFYVALYDSVSDTVSFPLAFENEQRVNWGSRRLGQGLTEYIVRNREPLLMPEDIPERLEELGIEMIGTPALSWMGVPLLVGGQVLGMMALQSYTTPRLYDEHDLDLLTAIASQTAIALQSAGLFEDIQQKAERERQIYEITSKIRRSPDIATILQTAVDELGQALQTDRALVRLMPASRAGQQDGGDGPDRDKSDPPDP